MNYDTLTDFKAHIRYRLFFAGACMLIILFAWNLINSFTFGALFFLLVCAGFSINALRNSFSRISLTAHSVTLHPPFGAGRTVKFRQLIQVSESGRFGKAITILYHPTLEDGLLDLDDAQSLFLPEVENQTALFNMLKAHIIS